MAAPRVALKRLSSLILSGSPRTVKTLPVASRFSSSGSLRPGTLQAASFSTKAADEPYDPFYVIAGTSQSQSFPPLHHESLMKNEREGCYVCFYMMGVGKGDVKVWMENGELIAEGIKEKDLEHEDGTKTQYRYRMFGPPNVLYDHSAIKAEIKNGLLRVFVPRRNQDLFIPRKQYPNER